MRGFLPIVFCLVAACGAPAGSGYLVYVRDRQGSVVAAVDDQGRKVWETHDDAFGLRLSSSGTEIPREFLDQPFDDETGFYQFHYRSYDPATAQWLTPDPKLISDQEYCTTNAELCNPYAYGGDRPGEWPDPDGREVHVELSESNLVLHATLAVFGTDAAQVVAAIQSIQAKVLDGSGNRIDVTIHVYNTREEAPANETPISANLSCGGDESVTYQSQSLVVVGKDITDAERAPRVLWHELLHLAGADDGYKNVLLSNGMERSVSLPGQERSYMGNLKPDQLQLTPLVQQQLGDPDVLPNGGLTLTPSCEGTPPMDGDVSRPSQP